MNYSAHLILSRNKTAIYYFLLENNSDKFLLFIFINLN